MPAAAAQPAQPALAQQAVLETSRGTIVLDLLAEHAPMHVALFIKTARSGGFDGTVFHRVVLRGLIQGGDPLSVDPAAVARYGSGGLNLVAREANGEKHTRGAVAAVTIPGKPDSGGVQFFICIADQPALDGQFTVFARVAEGIAIAQAISESPADDKGMPLERVVISNVTVRDKPAATAPLFSTETIDELRRLRAVLDTSLGPITLELFPDKAPTHVRQFLRLAQLGVYDGMSWHRVVKGFVVQTGHLPTRTQPLTESHQRAVEDLKAEFNDQSHQAGIVSMARLADPDSASTSFFIVTAATPKLDGQYTAFGRVVAGMEVVADIESAPLQGETPVERIELRSVRVLRP